MAQGISLLLVDDQVLFLESLKVVIESVAPDMTILGTAVNGEEAVQRLRTIADGQSPRAPGERAAKPVDAVLLDVRMPVMDGVTAAKIIHGLWPDIFIIMLTTFEDDVYVREAMKNGASGYLLKNIAPKMLVSAVRAVCDGSILMDPQIAGSLLQSMISDKRKLENLAGETLPDWFFGLGRLEVGICESRYILVLLGKSNKEIAADANIGEQTVRNYISTIYGKLGVPDRRALIAKAREVSLAYFS